MRRLFKPKEVKSDAVKVLESGKRKYTVTDWVWITGGVLSTIASIPAMILWFANTRNAFMGLIAIALFMAGGYIIYSKLSSGKSDTAIVSEHTVTRTGKENTVTFYAKKNDKGKVILGDMLFENLPGEELKKYGQPHHYMNLGKSYYERIYDITTNTFIPLAVPDGSYVDPAIMGKYMELPAQRKYLKHRDSLLKMLGPGLLALMDGIGFIVIITQVG
jgi:hypothetical protein